MIDRELVMTLSFFLKFLVNVAFFSTAIAFLKYVYKDIIGDLNEGLAEDLRDYTVKIYDDFIEVEDK